MHIEKLQEEFIRTRQFKKNPKDTKIKYLLKMTSYRKTCKLTRKLYSSKANKQFWEFLMKSLE